MKRLGTLARAIKETPAVSAAIVAGIVSLVVSLTTVVGTYWLAGQRAVVDKQLADQRAVVDKQLADQRAVVDKQLAEQRSLFDGELARLKGKIDEHTSLEKIVSEQRETNRRPFLQKQLELCFEATDAASRLALETNVTEWEKSRFTFWRLYWGILGIVEDQAVANAMVQLGELVPPTTPSNPPELPMNSLRNHR